jgi:hypothetical protein
MSSAKSVDSSSSRSEIISFSYVFIGIISAAFQVEGVGALISILNGHSIGVLSTVYLCFDGLLAAMFAVDVVVSYAFVSEPEMPKFLLQNKFERAIPLYVVVCF